MLPFLMTWKDSITRELRVGSSYVTQYKDKTVADFIQPNDTIQKRGSKQARQVRSKQHSYILD